MLFSASKGIPAFLSTTGHIDISQGIEAIASLLFQKLDKR
jgi:hypothetical protein